MAPDPTKEFAARLRAALEVSGKTQADLARTLKSSRAAVTEWIQGQQLPNGFYMILLPKALKVSANWLFTGHGPQEAMASPGADLRASQRGGLLVLAQIELALEDVRQAWMRRGPVGERAD